MKKRKFDMKRVILLVTAVVIVISLLTTASVYGINVMVQKQRHQTVADILETRQAFLSQADKLQNTGNVSDTAFNGLRALAKEDNASAYVFLNEYLDGEYIDADTYEKILALQPDVDGHRYLHLLENAYQIPEDYINFLLKDTDRLSFVEAWLHQEDYQNPPAALTESLSSVPHLLQWDLRWGYLPYGDSNVAFAGCAPTCLAMVYSYLNQDASITPYSMAQYSMEHDYYVNGVGTAHALLYNSGEDFGITTESIPLDANSVKAALASGKILVFSMNPGDFTTTGHFIVVTGLEGDKLIVNDPNSIKNSKKRWDIQTVLNQTAAIWAFSK